MSAAILLPGSLSSAMLESVAIFVAVPTVFTDRSRLMPSQYIL